jgi:hypothetical protein
LLLLKVKRLRVIFALSFLFSIAVIIAFVNDVSCATAPLTPTVEVTPARVDLGKNITLTVRVLVNQESTVSVSRPQANGAGDAILLSENSSVIAKPYEQRKRQKV